MKINMVTLYCLRKNDKLPCLYYRRTAMKIHCNVKTNLVRLFLHERTLYFLLEVVETILTGYF